MHVSQYNSSLQHKLIVYHFTWVTSLLCNVPFISPWKVGKKWASDTWCQVQNPLLALCKAFDVYQHWVFYAHLLGQIHSKLMRVEKKWNELLCLYILFWKHFWSLYVLSLSTMLVGYVLSLPLKFSFCLVDLNNLLYLL